MGNFFGYILLTILLLLTVPLAVGANMNIKLNLKNKSVTDTWYLGFYAVSIWVVTGVLAYFIPQIIFNNI
jgi:hypothetical protein